MNKHPYFLIFLSLACEIFICNYREQKKNDIKQTNKQRERKEKIIIIRYISLHAKNMRYNTSICTILIEQIQLLVKWNKIRS